MKWKGKLEFQDLGSGSWVLKTRAGKRLQLLGDIPANLDGCSVVVRGSAVEGLGFAMVGAANTIQVTSIEGA